MGEQADAAMDREYERAAAHAEHKGDEDCLLCLAERDPRVRAVERMSRPGVGPDGRRFR